MNNEEWTLDEWLTAISLGSLCLGAFPLAAIAGGILGVRKTAKPIGRGIKATSKGLGKGLVATARGTKKMLTPKQKEIIPPPPPTKEELVAQITEEFRNEIKILRSLSHDFNIVGDIEEEIELRRQKYLNRIARIMK